MKRTNTFLNIIENRIYYIGILTIILIVILLLPYESVQNVAVINGNKPLYNKTIVVDPGHGGIDGGTYFEDILEKNINLQIGLKLKEKLIKKGGTVIMTREIDDSLDDHTNSGNRHRQDLSNRVKIVNDNETDIFISVHVNHMRNVNRMGPIVFYYTYSDKSIYLAEHIQNYLNNLLAYKNMEIEIKRVATPGDYYILRNTLPPGVIVETGFISNEIDRMLLLEKEHQNEIAELITKGIIDYFNNDY